MLAVWHMLVFLAMLFLPASFILGRVPWALSRANLLLVLALGGLYLMAAGATFVATRANRRPPILGAVAVGSTATAVACIGAILAPGIQFSRPLLVAASLLIPLGLVVPAVVRLRRWHSPSQALLAATAVTAALVMASPHIRTDATRYSRQDRPIAASQQFLNATYVSGFLPVQKGTNGSGGAITPHPSASGYLVARARGDLHHVSWGEGGEPVVRSLEYRVPVNRDEFDADAAPGVSRDAFRVADILAAKDGNGRDILYVSHHYWKRDEQCFVMRVSSLVLSGPTRERGSPASDWRTLFETAPCLRIVAARGTPFAGVQAGGNLEFLDRRTLLLTVGDHQFDGWYRQPNLVTDERAHYGKTVAIDVDSGKASVFTLGHRNPQGLAVDPDRGIWSTEHGPQGGDELNLLRSGGDYGYPNHSYGTEYGSVVWPPGEAGRESSAAVRPVFAWVPSIGISDLIVVNDPAFQRWRGDLLITSLRARALWRVRLEKGRVAYTEPIELGERIRDIATRKGEIVLWTDRESVIRLRPDTKLDQGSVLFANHCGGCHDDEVHRIGPTLRGVFDRRVASANGYAYSDALRHLWGTWDESRLDAFLTSPEAVAPGTTMVFQGIADPEDRRKIIQYIGALK